MSNELTARQTTPARRRYRLDGNTMIFPRALRDAIPDLPTCVGRALELAEVEVHWSDSPLSGRRVNVRFDVRETGKLDGEFTVRMDLDPAAARALADALRDAAAEAEGR